MSMTGLIVLGGVGLVMLWSAPPSEAGGRSSLVKLYQNTGIENKKIGKR
jgi:hypothetical protein